jgi:hypothetical protein
MECSETALGIELALKQVHSHLAHCVTSIRIEE